MGESKSKSHVLFRGKASFVGTKGLKLIPPFISGPSECAQQK